MLQLNIAPSSGIPIYKQVYEQIERMILNGTLLPEVFLPSVRQLALRLEVNPMTISKAYGLLEERGYLSRQRGKGMLVAKQEISFTEQGKMMMLDKMIESLITESKQMGISKAALLEKIKQKITVKASLEQGE